MIIFNSLDNINIDDNTAIALGNFDGIHAGHKVILQDAVSAASECGIKSLCFTFSNHPYNFIMNKNVHDPDALKLICKESEKISIIEDMGFDYLVNIPFDEVMMNMSAHDFFKEVIISKLNARVISVGFNYTYGVNAEGNAERLYKEGRDNGIDVRVHDAVKVFHNVVSSTLIRKALSEGNIEAVSMYLDREYAITDTVMHGKKNGALLEHPTINFNNFDDLQLPINGVYASRTIIDGVEYKSITNIGVNPTIGDNEKTIETHVLKYNGDAYDKVAKVILDRFIREERKFNSIDELRNQIKLDIQEITE